MGRPCDLQPCARGTISMIVKYMVFQKFLWLFVCEILDSFRISFRHLSSWFPRVI